MERIIETHSAQETWQAGYEMGCRVDPGKVITLIGDLGVGKTVYTQGVAAGLGIRETVNSPTFTILQVYDDGRIPLYHYDVYRIGDSEEILETGWDEYVCSDGVCLIEWADLIPDLIEELPAEEIIRVGIEKDLQKGFDYRRITVSEDSEHEDTSN